MRSDPEAFPHKNLPINSSDTPIPLFKIPFVFNSALLSSRMLPFKRSCNIIDCLWKHRSAWTDHRTEVQENWQMISLIVMGLKAESTNAKLFEELLRHFGPSYHQQMSNSSTNFLGSSRNLDKDFEMLPDNIPNTIFCNKTCAPTIS